MHNIYNRVSSRIEVTAIPKARSAVLYQRSDVVFYVAYLDLLTLTETDCLWIMLAIQERGTA